jgi:hypothetical protein
MLLLFKYDFKVINIKPELLFFGGGGEAQRPPVGYDLLIHEVSRSHTTTHHIY